MARGERDFNAPAPSCWLIGLPEISTLSGALWLSLGGHASLLAQQHFPSFAWATPTTPVGTWSGCASIITAGEALMLLSPISTWRASGFHMSCRHSHNQTNGYIWPWPGTRLAAFAFM